MPCGRTCFGGTSLHHLHHELPTETKQIDAFLARTPGASLEKQWQSTPDAFGSDLMYGAMLKKHKKR